MISIDDLNELDDKNCYPIMIDGKHAGYIEDDEAQDFVSSIRVLKIKG